MGPFCVKSSNRGVMPHTFTMTPVPRPSAKEHSADRAEQEMLDSSTRGIPECHRVPPSSLCIPNTASRLERGTRRGEVPHVLSVTNPKTSPAGEDRQDPKAIIHRIPKLCMVAHSYKMTQVFKGHLPSRNTEDHTCLNSEVKLLLLMQHSQVGEALSQQKPQPSCFNPKPR